MSIDWFTVLAQLANFLLLIWLLRRFLYRPILDGIDAREAEIARRLAVAEVARERAEAAEADFRQQHALSLASQEQQVKAALQSTRAEREQLLRDARLRLEQEQQQWRLELEQEAQDFVLRLQQAGSQTLAELTRKALHELADAKLEVAIARQLAPRLAALAAELRHAAGARHHARICSRHPLTADEQRQIRQAFDEALSAALPGIEWEFVTDPEQAHGLNLELGSVQLAWTLDSYMDEFERLLAQNHPGSPLPISVGSTGNAGSGSNAAHDVDAH